MSLEKDLSLANRLISALPAPERALFLEYSQLVELKPDKVLVAAGQPLEHAYFPVDSFVSVVLPAGLSPAVQVGLVGNEGMCPTSLVLRVNSSALSFRVQGAGRALRIHHGALQFRLLEDALLRDVLNRYVDVSQTQLAQQIACLKHHRVAQRLARWLLMTRDRAHSRELFLTHEVLAFMLGVRRESVTRAAGDLEKRGLISYSPGYVMLLDEAGLAGVACSCYPADRLAYERVLGRGDASAAD